MPTLQPLCFAAARSASPDGLVDDRAQRDALQTTRTEDEHAKIMRQTADLQDENSLTQDEGKDP